MPRLRRWFGRRSAMVKGRKGFSGVLRATRRDSQDQMRGQRRSSGMLTPEQAGAQPFGSALPNLRMNRAAARFTSSAPTSKSKTAGLRSRRPLQGQRQSQRRPSRKGGMAATLRSRTAGSQDESCCGAIHKFNCPGEGAGLGARRGVGVDRVRRENFGAGLRGLVLGGGFYGFF